MRDLISRQAAIRWVKTECNPYGKPTLDFESGKRVMEHLKTMPSVQPDVPDTNVGDLISRQVAIDICHKNYDGILDFRSDGRTVALSFEDIINSVPSVQPEPHWIPCSKRLPERGEDVLVTRDYDGREDNNKSCRYVEVASCYGEDEDITWNSFSDEYKMHPKNHHVIAWMPLPEPYQEEGDSE